MRFWFIGLDVVLFLAACGGGAAPAGSALPAASSPPVAAKASSPAPAASAAAPASASAKPAASAAASAQAATSAGAAGGNLQPIRVMLPHNVLFDVAVPYYVADEKGFFKDEGLRTEAVFTKGGATNVQAVVSGGADVGCCTGAHALWAAFDQGAPLRIISSEIIGIPDLLWYAKGDAPIKNADDLAGKKVGFSEAGSSSNMAVLALNDIVKKDTGKTFTPVPAGSPPDNFTAVKTGQIDAGWTTWPFFGENITKGEIKIVAQGADITALSKESVRVNFVHADFMDKHPGLVAAFMRAWAKGLKFIYTNREDTAKIWAQRAQLKDPMDVLLKTWDYHPEVAQALTEVQGVDLINQQAVDFKFIQKALTKEQLDKLLVTKFLPK